MPIDARTHIGDVRLTVADLDRALAFYTGTLGFRLAGRVDDTATLTADGRTPLLRLTGLPGAPPQPEGTTGLYHFAILTPSRAALGRSLRALVEAGYPLTGASDHLVSEALYLDDPDGNGIEIYRDRPRAEWPMAGAQVRMSNAPLDLEGLLREAEGGSAQGLDPATCIGHIHLHVGDLAEAKAFYVSVLGFDVMQEWGGAALFVSAGGYHHHIGLNTWAGVGAPPPPPGVAGLRAYTIQLPDEGARASVLARLEAAGIETAGGEDRVALSDPWGNGILLQTAAEVA
jgi:catechol 2,3-dioxygenase